MKLLNKLNQTAEFNKLYANLSNYAKHVEKNLEKIKFNTDFITNQQDELDKFFGLSNIPLQTSCELYLKFLTTRIKKLNPANAKQTKKKEELSSKVEDLTSKYLKINPAFEKYLSSTQASV